MKKKLISPRVDYLETDRTVSKSYTNIKSTNKKSSPNGGRGVKIITNFLLQDDGYLLQEDGFKIYL
jgi:hypothetical protein